MISRMSRISNYYVIPQMSNMRTLFAPRTLVEGSCSRFALCVWRQRSHLCPIHQHRLQRSRSATFPSCYWLLLLAGDVELNPGPERWPLCATHKIPVRKNQYLATVTAPEKLNCLEGADDALVIGHLNVRSLLPKKDEIQLFLQQHTCAFVFGLSETWLHDSVPTGELAVSGF